MQKVSRHKYVIDWKSKQRLDQRSFGYNDGWNRMRDHFIKTLAIKTGATKSFMKLIKTSVFGFPFPFISHRNSPMRNSRCVLSHIHKLDNIPLKV